MEQRPKLVIFAVIALVVVLAVIVIYWFASQPAATIEVKTGSRGERAGVVITVIGSHFPANKEIYVGLAAPNVPPTAGTSYMTTKSDKDGKFSVPFQFPNTPNWTTLPEVTVYAGTPEGDVVATTRLQLSSIALLLTPQASATLPPTITPLPTLPSATPTASLTPVPATSSLTPVPATSSPTPVPIPVIILQPAAGRVGDTILISGRGWRPNEALGISLLGLSTQSSLKVGAVATDADGKFSLAFVFPTNWGGPTLTTVLVRSQDGSEQALAVFEVYGLITPTFTPTPTVLPPTPLIVTGWLGQYYGNQWLGGDAALLRNDNDLAFDWGTNSPAPGIIPSEHFSVRWTRSLYFPQGNYSFLAVADDGVRVWLDGNLIIDEWHSATGTTYKHDVSDLSDGMHILKVEYYQDTGQAQIHMWWKQVSPPTSTPTLTSVPTSTTQ